MDSNEEHLTYAIQLATSTSLTMVLVNTIKLKVLEAISEAGSDAQLSSHEIATRLSITNQNAPDMLDRMLRLLASHSIVTCTERDHESRPVRVYGLTPVAKYFIPNEDGASLGALMELNSDKVFIDSWFMEHMHTNIQPNAMVTFTTIVMKEILECYQGFTDVKNLVDVGGGLGLSISMIVSKHPTIKGINFDLPHVIYHAPLYSGIEHVGGDMFHEVPRCDVVFLKWILHNWSDDHCVKLLKNCFRALPHDGKVIVVDAILPFLPDKSPSVRVTTHFDALMMTQYPGGKERTEYEFLVLAKDAGFVGIRKECFACNFWVMEFYK